MKITCCIVLYKNDLELLRKAIDSVLSFKGDILLYLIDNSPTDLLKDIIKDERIIYFHTNSNFGFGYGHNLAMRLDKFESNYHIVLNPDIHFNNGVIENIISFMESNKNIGVIMPKVEFPNGKIQYLAKLLPTPFDFILRRVYPLNLFFKKLNDRFELRKFGYDKIIDVPFLSGCFLLFRTKVLNQIEGFDENIFMYTEDIDICRRTLNVGYRVVFYPKVSVIHEHEVKSFLKFKNLKIYLLSAFYYFNKWGWFFDKERKKINSSTLEQSK